MEDEFSLFAIPGTCPDDIGIELLCDILLSNPKFRTISLIYTGEPRLEQSPTKP